MNPDQPSREQIEPRLTALLLGELPADEAALLRYTLSQDPALQQLHDELKAALALVREVEKKPAEGLANEAAPLKLSAERRQRLLAHFKTPRPKTTRDPLFWLKRIEAPRLITVLVVVALLALLAAMLLPSLAAAKRKAQHVSTLSMARQRTLEALMQAADNESAPAPSPSAPAPASMQVVKALPNDTWSAGHESRRPQPNNAAAFSLGASPNSATEGSPQVVTLAPAPQVAAPPTMPPVQIALPAAETGPEVAAPAFGTSEAEKNVVYKRGENAGVMNSAFSPGALPPALKPPLVAENAQPAQQRWIVPSSATESSSGSAPVAGGGFGGGGFSRLGAIGGGETTHAFNRTSVLSPTSKATMETGLAGKRRPEKTEPAATQSSADAGLSIHDGALLGRVLAEAGKAPSAGAASGGGNNYYNPNNVPLTRDMAVKMLQNIDTPQARSLLQSLESSDKSNHGVEGYYVLQSDETNALVATADRLATTPVAALAAPAAAGAFQSESGQEDLAKLRDLTASTAQPVPDQIESRAKTPDASTGVLAQKQVDRFEKAMQSEQVSANNLAQTDRPLRKPAPNAPVPQPEILTLSNAISTFAMNVSDVSFKFAEASLQKGQLPDPASIRSEEFINAFDYRDPEAAPGQPLAFLSERARSPFAHNRDLLRFSVKAAAAGRSAGRALNLVLLLDTSGSMERADRVAIIREALRVLAAQLQPQDTVSVVTFARTARLWADGIHGDQAGATFAKVGGITPEGGTNLEEAMRLAYETARRHYLAGGLNRVVLLTDGAANLGTVDPGALQAKVEAQRKQGIALDCFGIGWEDFNDDLLEALSSHGDGRYAFLNSPEDAARDFATKLAGALQVAAADLKVQVEFNPQRVLAYRQIGYARHQLTKEQFRDNSVAAGEIAAQEAGNALYTVEVNPRGEGPIATVHVRYRVPGTQDYREHSWEVPYTGTAPALTQASPAMRLAAAAGAFSEWLAASPYAQEVTPDELLKILNGVPAVYGADDRPQQLETMIREARSLEGK